MTIKAEQLHSGSDGNLYTITAFNGDKLIIELGVTWKKFIKAMDHKIQGVLGALISHGHL
ncbi:hypothetical protein KAR91_85615 [Candidatus Pacearchaeota archaeon]|nr:hypothetical protein [Candidatus Pacearchaeota archaeon]